MSSTARKLNTVNTNNIGTTRRPLRVAKPVAITTVDVHKSFQAGSVEVPVLRGANLTVHESEFLAIVGQSGSGKSTL